MQGETGTSHEADAFDKPQLNTELYNRKYAELVQKYKPQAKLEGWIPFNDAKDLVISSTLPLKLKRPFANELRTEVAKKLNLDPSRVRFFSAIGTPLDLFHGTDAIVRYLEENGTPIDITLDVTKNSAKDQSKARVLVTDIEVDPQSNKQAFEKGIRETADAVASAISQELSALQRKQSGEHRAWRAKTA